VGDSLALKTGTARLTLLGLDKLGPKLQSIAIILISFLLLWGDWIIMMNVTEDLNNFSETMPIMFYGTLGIALIFAIGHSIYTLFRPNLEQ
jgi:hypothetical protein